LHLNWPPIVSAILLGAAITSVGLVVVTYSYGIWPTVPDMELAAGLGAALGGALTLI
jgi:hypothetical protein